MWHHQDHQIDGVEVEAIRVIRDRLARLWRVHAHPRLNGQIAQTMANELGNPDWIIELADQVLAHTLSLEEAAERATAAGPSHPYLGFDVNKLITPINKALSSAKGASAHDPAATGYARARILAHISRAAVRCIEQDADGQAFARWGHVQVSCSWDAIANELMVEAMIQEQIGGRERLGAAVASFTKACKFHQTTWGAVNPGVSDMVVAQSQVHMTACFARLGRIEEGKVALSVARRQYRNIQFESMQFRHMRDAECDHLAAALLWREGKRDKAIKTWRATQERFGELNLAGELVGEVLKEMWTVALALVRVERYPEAIIQCTDILKVFEPLQVPNNWPKVCADLKTSLVAGDYTTAQQVALANREWTYELGDEDAAHP